MQRKPLGRPGSPAPQKRSRYQSLIFDADRFFEAKEIETAFKIYQQALQEAPAGDNHVYAQLCRCYRKKARPLLKKERWPELIQVMEEMLKTNGQRPNLKGLDFKILAEAYFKNGQIEKATAAIAEALKLNPDLSSELKNLQQKIQAENLHQNFRQLF
ncbi:hypothetical protein COW36_00290 [bacterium (Candidatus Blackallbacteria) CG17_big_fil_post_rev_8_21_14_2_50_48_46]|uniref:Tetratricopeptide repeat protein n=1 Tax=bacterium (Candidatus Blackallbacteria) CG17_big_fil_post_rev_8_21_14_2_50_48_46 TaxID=2014261 RepID=A0A2M7GAV2_9BACT|nr:MAG: hypothetical protein COW64_10880 [bacterium (Candidatus Blackallbacteria) CG18_big_fil_WC_8_21_14_2_50_49_26]PIW19314.1 MAG: hypothetical protein COW36_00290 [bacterium (Candidatus Blackallbacteria) CG17_big_fil_post_rev_8_21_14_2_50_48_46]PIW49082.1 MAG: hypothetical protein COW20_08165 [bacterium (Candidatus Blackallbacteria) CG13_big_fil_rev_8_21_14_2_50_49_14]